MPAIRQHKQQHLKRGRDNHRRHHHHAHRHQDGGDDDIDEQKRDIDAEAHQECGLQLADNKCGNQNGNRRVARRMDRPRLRHVGKECQVVLAGLPQHKAFVDVGSTVNTGETICIIEAMKLLNEIESDFTGVIKKILVENGQPVEYGEPLFIIG